MPWVCAFLPATNALMGIDASPGLSWCCDPALTPPRYKDMFEMMFDGEYHINT
jgi:hypothetical protein